MIGEVYMKKIFTIPNILSMIRIIMIPVVVASYFKGNYMLTIILLLLSGLTDVVDGFIARRFNLITNVGKILDPIADKLTQFTVIVCLAWHHAILIPVAAIMFAKELLTLIGAVLFVKHGNATPYARWWGKMTTVILYATMVLFVISELTNVIPDILLTTAMSVTIACLVFSFFNYLVVYFDGRKTSTETSEKCE